MGKISKWLGLTDAEGHMSFASDAESADEFLKRLRKGEKGVFAPFRFYVLIEMSDILSRVDTVLDLIRRIRRMGYNPGQWGSFRHYDPINSSLSSYLVFDTLETAAALQLLWPWRLELREIR